MRFSHSNGSGCRDLPNSLGSPRSPSRSTSPQQLAPALATQWHPSQNPLQHPDHRGGGEDGAGREGGERPDDQAVARFGAPPSQQAGPALAIQWQGFQSAGGEEYRAAPGANTC